MKRSEAGAIINAVVALRNGADDQTAARNVVAFPAWAAGIAVKAGDRLKDGGKLYKVRSDHTTQADWKPESTPALYEPIDIEHGGTVSDPIPAAAGMTYYYNKYYSENGVLYRCIREDAVEGVVLHYLPSALVGSYFEVVE